MADPAPEVDQQAAGDSLTVEGQRFAIVPEWVIDADVGDCAFRLYAVLLRYGQSSGARMPSRATLARRLRKRSVDTVDRAMKELVALGAVVVERRHDGKQNLTNLYHVRTTAPGRTAAATSRRPKAGRTDAAGGPPDRAASPGRNRAATPAALARPNPESLTQEQPPPTSDELAEQCRALRRGKGLSSVRWSSSAVTAAVRRSLERGWPNEHIENALLAVAADPATRSPFRVAEAGPWWDVDMSPLPGERTPEEEAQLVDLERELDACDGRRALLQHQARQQLTERGAILNRESVVRCAVQLLRSGS